MKTVKITVQQDAAGRCSATIPDIASADGDDLCEMLRNLAAATAISGGLSEIADRDTPHCITIYTSRECVDDERERIQVNTGPTLEEDDPDQLQTVDICSLGMMVSITHLSPESLTRLGLWLIDVASAANARR